MENKIIRTKGLKLVRVKYFDMEHGAELMDLEAYAFITWNDEEQKYVNVFDAADSLPVYARTFYPNVLPNGEEYGNRLQNIYGPVEDGPCFVIEPVDVRKLIGLEAIGLDGLKEYVYRSDKFFVDRIQLILNENPKRRFKMRKMLKSDCKKMDELREYMIREPATHEQKVKRFVK